MGLLSARRATARLVIGFVARLITIVILPPFPMLAAAVETGSLEYAVKATYLYKFAGYVDWPANAFASPDSPIKLCIAGEDPFGTTLDAAVRSQRIAGRPLIVQRLKSVGRDSGCQILFVGGTDPLRAQMINAVRGSGVLTVTDSRDPGGSAGIINFVIRENRVRFDIDEEAAARNGISISSKLLGLALNVRQRGQQ